MIEIENDGSIQAIEAEIEQHANKGEALTVEAEPVRTIDVQATSEQQPQPQARVEAHESSTEQPTGNAPF